MKYPLISVGLLYFTLNIVYNNTGDADGRLSNPKKNGRQNSYEV